MEKSLVFISHATADRHYAMTLAECIEQTMDGIETFVASDPIAISSGGDWVSEILENLSNADAIVIIYSRSSRSRMWVGFELGYSWRQYDGKNIHCIFDPALELPSPLNLRQAKEFTDIASMAKFFRGLAQDLDREYQADEKRITEIVDLAPKPDRFFNWKSLLENGNWTQQEFLTSEGYETVWISEDDMSYQIVETGIVAVKDFDEPWVKRFPDKHTSSYYVNLVESGNVVEQEIFVSLDGGRYFVPIPEISVGDYHGESSDLTYYYDHGSLRFLLGKVIGRYYYMENLGVFAARKGIEIR